MAYWDQEFQRIHSPILRYSFAVVSVAIALGVAFALQHYKLRDLELPVLTVAIAFTTWYAGTGPSVLAVLLSSVSFDYFFTEPFYSFDISRRDLLTFSFSSPGQQLSPRSVLFDAESRTAFVKPATTFRSKWNRRASMIKLLGTSKRK